MKFWFWSQETFLCAAGLIVTILLSSFTSRVFASVIFFYFNGSEAWFYHIEQGQMYALYAFAFALLYLIVKKCRHKQEWSGIWEAFFAWLRPLFGIIVLANLYKKDKKGLIAFSVVGVALIIMTSIADQWKHWEEYRAAIKEYTLEVNRRLSPDTSHQIAIPPAILENCVTSKAPTLVNDAGALYSLQHYFKRLGLEINNSGFFIAITLMASLIGLYTFHRRIGAVSIEQEVVFLFLVYLFSELISPTVRNPYNLVQWCVPSMLIAAGFRNNKLAAYLLFAGFILNSQLIHLLPKYQREIGELLLIAASLIFIYRRDSLTAVRK